MSTGFFGVCEGRENSSRFCTILAARRAWRCVKSSWRFIESSRPSRSRTNSVTPRIAVKGLFNSCATPASIWPIAASFSDWISCSPSRFSSVMSRPERTTPSIFPLSSNSGLKLKRMRRHSPSLCRTRTSRELKLCLPFKMSEYSASSAGRSSGCVRPPNCISCVSSSSYPRISRQRGLTKV